MTAIRTLVAGLGSMGRSHALAYHRDPAFEIVGLVNRSTPALPPELRLYDVTPTSTRRLRALKPDLVSIATYSDTHADYACAAMDAGAHVFVEKPLATTTEDAERVAKKAKETKPQGRRRLYPPPPSLLAAPDRRGPRARAALRLPPQPQPAELRPHLGGAQGADADHLAHRRLRRPLRRRHVPDHRRRPRRGPRHGPPPLRRDRRTTCTTTATSRSSSPTARWAGTKPPGAR